MKGEGIRWLPLGLVSANLPLRAIYGGRLGLSAGDPGFCDFPARRAPLTACAAFWYNSARHVLVYFPNRRARALRLGVRRRLRRFASERGCGRARRAEPVPHPAAADSYSNAHSHACARAVADAYHNSRRRACAVACADAVACAVADAMGGRCLCRTPLTSDMILAELEGRPRPYGVLDTHV